MNSKIVSVLGLTLALSFSSVADAQNRDRKRLVCRDGEIKSDALVIANAAVSPNLALSYLDLYKAFAHQVVIQGRLVKNPYKKWSDINSALPKEDIETFGPPPGSPLRELLIEVALEEGAMEYEPLAALREFPNDAKGNADAKAAAIAMGISHNCLGADHETRSGETYFKCIAGEVRKDGGWVNAGTNYHAIVATLQQVPLAVGIFNYEYLAQNSDKLKGTAIEEVAPTNETIESGTYPLARRTCVENES